MNNKIYSQDEVSEELLNEECVAKNKTSGEERIYDDIYNIDFVVNMPFVGQGQSVNLDYLLQLITEDTVTFNYNVKLQIEAGKANSGKNAQGWLRTGTYYFKQLLKQCSYAKDFLSDSNIKKINKGISPIVDDVFINYFLSKGKDYTACRDEKLVHHHIGEDGQAIFMP